MKKKSSSNIFRYTYSFRIELKNFYDLGIIIITFQNFHVILYLSVPCFLSYANAPSVLLLLVGQKPKLIRRKSDIN